MIRPACVTWDNVTTRINWLLATCKFRVFLFLFYLSSSRKARALRRQGSELDTLPEDEPTPDSGTSSLESPKRPLGSRYRGILYCLFATRPPNWILYGFSKQEGEIEFWLQNSSTAGFTALGGQLNLNRHLSKYLNCCRSFACLVLLSDKYRTRVPKQNPENNSMAW